MRLKVGEVVDVPTEVRVLQEHRFAAGRTTSGDCPGVRAVFPRCFALAAEMGRGDVNVVGEPMRMRDDIDPSDREYLTHGRVYRGWIRPRVVVDAAGEGIEIVTELGRLCLVPNTRPRWNSVLYHPFRGVFVFGAPVLGA